jgi:glyoxylase-like metal-dependent hydrolase (beta-lactamase superfamily II)
MNVSRPARTAALLLSFAAGSIAAATAEAPPGPFSAESLGPGIWLMRPASYGGEYTNSLLVERADGLLVVEAQPTTEAAETLLAAVAGVSQAPVRFLVLSHPHSESAGGAAAFPRWTLVVVSREAADRLGTAEFDFGAEMRARADDPEGWTPPPRPRPTLLIGGPTLLDDPSNPVELLPGAASHCPGNMLVKLPEQNLLYLGPLLAGERNPYAADGNIGHWLGVLNGIARARPEKLVPLRGPVGDLVSLRHQRDGFAWVRGRVELGFVDQMPPGEIGGWILADPKLGTYFDTEARPFLVPAFLDKAVEEALRKRGRGFRY